MPIVQINPRIKIRHIHTFISVAQHHSFAKAATELSISQPAVSKVIKELEDIVDNRLFERTTHQVTLTAAGLTLLRYVGPAMRTVGEGFSVASRKAQDQASLRVGALATVATFLVPNAIRHWHSVKGFERIHLVTGPSTYLLSELRKGDLDIVVGRMSDAREIKDLNYHHIYTEPLVLAVRAGHPLTEHSQMKAGMLADYPWIVPQPKSTLRPKLDRFFVENGIQTPIIHLETSSLSVSRHYTLETDSIWAAPQESVLADIDLGRLTILSVPLEQTGGSIGYCLNRTLNSSPQLEGFCDSLAQIIRAK